MGEMVMNTYQRETAYYLAEKLTDCLDSEEQLKIRIKASEMLMEQAEHINHLDILLDQKYEIIKQQKKQIAELQKK